MFSNSQTRALQSAFSSVQNRIAYSLRNELREHSVLVSVSVSDKSGNVLQTIEPDRKTSSRTAPVVSDNGQFATGIYLKTNPRRIAAMCEIAAYVFSLADDDACVVSATFQDSVAWSSTTMDYVAQCFLKDGKLVIKEVDVADRS